MVAKNSVPTKHDFVSQLSPGQSVMKASPEEETNVQQSLANPLPRGYPARFKDLLSGGVGPLTAPVSPTHVAIIGAMPLEQLSDEELVVQYRALTDARDRDQHVNELFRRNYARVSRWCLRFTTDRESAADLAQEVFAKAYQNLGSYQGQAKFSTWLFTIARNHCVNAARANARQATELKAGVDEEFLAEIQDLGPSPYSAMERQSSAELVRSLLSETLDETEKVVFTLHYGEELPLDAITRLLGLENQSGAKAFIVSARRKLARRVQQWKARGRYTPE